MGREEALEAGNPWRSGLLDVDELVTNQIFAKKGWQSKKLQLPGA